jgi:hypothetical protein
VNHNYNIILREMVGTICREVVTSKKRMNEIIGTWVQTENLCVFISIVRMFTLQQWNRVTVSIQLACVMCKMDYM